jgi:class I fructose-bisphosphate aldolase
MLNSGGVSKGSDFKQAIRAAIINKRAGGSGIIMGRKVFSVP